MDEQFPLLDLRNLKALSVLGRGAKGVAFLIQNEDTDSETLALKAISKDLIERKNSEDGYRRIWFERDVLKMFQHPLLPKLRGFVVTEKIVGFVIEHCSGGDLKALRKKQTEKMFSDDIIRFYAAELVLALEYLHGLGIVYRDLKPENVLIQENGHLMLVDFDLSAKLSLKSPQTVRSSSAKSEKNLEKNTIFLKKKRLPAFLLCGTGISLPHTVSPPENNEDSVREKSDSVSEKSNSFVGTEDYVAPEIIQGNGHDFAVDWWSLGVVLYEMLYGFTPFRGTNRKETFYRILTKRPELVGEPTSLRDLIERLLEKDPKKRISVEGIKGHEFFVGLDWESILRISRPPFIPVEKGEEGNMGIIDVEEFVEKVFHGDEGKEKSLGNKNDNNEWVDSFRHPSKDADFLVF
ncbi:AGC (cAMP-dependent, cGMP-dependent and protein kinase C) kinase family protein [Tasmannia lanceolata]|uniref:AGC (cAMP-dependent, cGMP-dependent and protein kinase C) kinase family protein n=1 Tax=Tasmannia lanceolata TaxID=3420 RepID=UPI0040630AA7